MKEKNKECKKISVMVALGIVASTAAFAGPGTMANNNMNNNTMTEVMTIEQVRGLSDNSPVIVRGYLLRQNGENSYIFQDETGTINLEIDQEDWGGMSVSPSDYVEVWGEVDKNGASMIEIDVSAMKKL
ncbi:MAG: NirD/YgiW/YdeI family stress tolerance protein [Alphaproteobacteria bacterium]|nr:NirD/YgiW/YdeI family stress tolerance protein [Alphaproteobacteria bacterium]